MKNLVKKVGSGTAYVGIKALSKVALPAAVCSTMYDGSYVARGYGGLKTTLGFLYNLADAYVYNLTFQARDTINGAALDIVRAMGDAAGNIQDDPDKVVYTALGTFLVLKAPEIGRAGVSRFKNWRTKRELEKYKAKSLEDRTKK